MMKQPKSKTTKSTPPMENCIENMNTEALTLKSRVSPISKRHDIGRTTIPRPVMIAMGMDIGDTLLWTVNIEKKTIAIQVKKQAAIY